jgi:hypothetical protein
MRQGANRARQRVGRDLPRPATCPPPAQRETQKIGCRETCCMAAAWPWDGGYSGCIPSFVRVRHLQHTNPARRLEGKRRRAANSRRMLCGQAHLEQAFGPAMLDRRHRRTNGKPTRMCSFLHLDFDLSPQHTQPPRQRIPGQDSALYGCGGAARIRICGRSSQGNYEEAHFPLGTLRRNEFPSPLVNTASTRR